ncbi:MAG TPA: ATPase domain-containing protein [Trebonia sp.]|nr:ATPase domain-containing protein [Trebonia sp.]
MADSRLLSGHEPLDAILDGGLPGNGITVIMGLPGTGKTILAEQYTFHNARPARPAVYFSTLSEPLEKIVRFGQTLDFFDAAAIGRSVFYEDLSAGRDGLAAVGERVTAVLRERHPGIIVIDSFKALHTLAGSDGEFRRFLHQLAGRLTAFPVASLWIGEYESAEAATSPEFAVADAIVELTAVPQGQRELRSLHVRKLRGSGFLSGQHAYRVTSSGLKLFPRLADIPATSDYQLGQDRISTGVPSLDAMLGGGLWPGASTMIAGPSGSGKTVLGLHFLHGGAEQGERGIFATLQENPTQLSRMIAGLGWPPAHPAIEVMYRSPVDIYIDEWVHDLLHAAEAFQARRVVIDSLMDLQMASVDETRFREFMYSLAQRFSRQGISLLITLETPGLLGAATLSGFPVSHLADNAILLSHLSDHGRMARSLAILKTRASDHDPVTRTFSIGPEGITIRDPVTPAWPGGNHTR